MKKGIHQVGAPKSVKIYKPATPFPRVTSCPTHFTATRKVAKAIIGCVALLIPKLIVPRLNLYRSQSSSTTLALLMWSMNQSIHELNLICRMLSNASVVVFIQLSFAPMTHFVNQAVTFAKKKFKKSIPMMIKTAAVNPHPKYM